MSEPTFLDLWKLLDESERRDACVAFWQSKSDGKTRVEKTVTERLAQQLNFRTQFVQKRPLEDKARFLAVRLGRAPLSVYVDAVLREYLVHNKHSVLEDFLDAAGIANVRGTIPENAERASAEALSKGIEVLRERHTPRDMLLYLGFLVALDDEFWDNLSEALSQSSVDLSKLHEQVVSAPIVDEAEDKPAEPEMVEAFTTLDHLLIKSVIAAANDAEGALRPDQLEDLIEETIAFSEPNRQRTYFHRGYLHAVFGKPYTFRFAGDNEERRVWYYCGVLFGLLRQGSGESCANLLQKEKLHTRELIQSRKTPCARMLLPSIYAPLRDVRDFALALEFLDAHGESLKPSFAVPLLSQIYYDAAALVRRGQTAEALPLLEMTYRLSQQVDGLPTEFRTQLQPQTLRKIAQCRQAEGNFSSADELLAKLEQIPSFQQRANALADRGLIRGGFRSLQAIVPRASVESNASLREGLLQGKASFLQAISEADERGERATNGHFALGILHFLEGESQSEAAARHLQQALTGMVIGDAYNEGHLTTWAKFCLGIALLEMMATEQYEHAADLVSQAIESPLVFPAVLWDRCLRAAACFDNPGIAETITRYFLSARPKEAIPLLEASELWKRRAEFRRHYFAWLLDQPLAAEEKAKRLDSLLRIAADEQDCAEIEQILERLEELAENERGVRLRFQRILAEPRLYCGVWEAEDVEYLRIKLHELEGEFDEIRAILHARIVRLLHGGSVHQLDEAGQLLVRLGQLNAPPNQTDELARLIALKVESEQKTGALSGEEKLRSGARVRVLYVGGNETQRNYESHIRADLMARYPALEIEFYYPGWSSNWNDHLTKVRQLMASANALVLSRLARTHFGRGVRKACNEGPPWFACTGSGRQAMQEAIRRAAIWATVDN